MHTIVLVPLDDVGFDVADTIGTKAIKYLKE